MGEFVEYLKEVFVHFGSIQAPKMFGKNGVREKMGSGMSIGLFVELA